MKKKISFIVISIMSICVQGCSKDPEQLELKRMDYTGNELRMDGYYYFEYTMPTTGITYRYIRFLFRNGIVLNAGTIRTSNLDTVEESFRDGSYYVANKNIQDRWGLFQVQGNNIKVQHWQIAAGSYKMVAVSAIGDILNNESFKINEMLDNRTFIFKEFQGKPDSVCRFIP